MGYIVTLFDGIHQLCSRRELFSRTLKRRQWYAFCAAKRLACSPKFTEGNSLFTRCVHCNEITLLEGCKRALIEGTGLKREDLAKRKGEWRNLCLVCARAKITRYSLSSTYSNSNSLWATGLVTRAGPSVLAYFKLLEGEF